MPTTHEAPSTDKGLDRSPGRGLDRKPQSPQEDDVATADPQARGYSHASMHGLLGSSELRAPAATAMRAVVMRHTQQQLGNRAVQRLVSTPHPRLLQRQCACGGTCEKCQAEAAAVAPPEHHIVQASMQGSVATPAPDSESLMPPASIGQRLPPDTQSAMETHFHTGLKDVRIHIGDAAAGAAQSIQADAYTIGNNIYFGPGKYQPGSQAGEHLLAHELSHVIQQAAGKAPTQVAASPSRGLLIGSPADPLEHEAERNAQSFTLGKPATGTSTDNSHDVRRTGWNSLTDNPLANAVSSGVDAGVAFAVDQVEALAPGAVSFFRNIREYFKNAISNGVGSLFGGIAGSLRERGIAGTLESMIGSLATGAVSAVGNFATGSCAAMGRLAEYLLEAGKQFGGSVLDSVKASFDAVSKPLEQLWTEYGTPAVDFIKVKLKGMWQEVQDKAARIWKWLEPLRKKAAAVWNKVTDALVEGRRDFNEWLEWIVPKAIEEWEKQKAKLLPYMGKVRTAAKVAGEIALLFSPAGPFVLAGAAVYGLYQGAKALWEHWLKPKTRAVREWWVNEGLPVAQAKLAALSGIVHALKGKLQAGLQYLLDGFTDLLDAIGAFSFLRSLQSIFTSVRLRIQSFKLAAEAKLEHWSQQLGALLAAAQPFFAKIREAFRQSLLVMVVGPFAFLDDGVWNTMIHLTQLVMSTPCLREIGGLIALPARLQTLAQYRAGFKQMAETIKNPDPLLEQFKGAVAPMIAKIEPEVRSRVDQMFTGRELYIGVLVWYYLGKSLNELKTGWWDQLKKIGHDLLWPWPEVAKEFMPMLHAFGDAISAVFNLEFNDATDKFLAGMRHFNAIAGALSGWFVLASVLIGAALGALGFILGPAGFGTVGAGASAGLAFAEEVGMGLLVIALATEGAVIAKAYFDLRFQNPRIAGKAERDMADSEASKSIAGSLISVATMGALLLLGAIAGKFASFLSRLVDEIPIVRDIAALLKDAKKSVGDFTLDPNAPAGDAGLTGKPGAPVTDLGPGADADSANGKANNDPNTTAKPDDFTPEHMDAANKKLADKVADPRNIRPSTREGYDVEVDLDDGEVYRRREDGTWCLFRNPVICKVTQPGTVNAAADAAKAKLDAPTVDDGAPAESPAQKSARIKSREAKEAARAETKSSIEEVQAKQKEKLLELQEKNAEVINAQKKIFRLKQEIPNLKGEARASALSELRKTELELNGDKGETAHGLLDEQKDLVADQEDLQKLKEDLESSLRLERPPLRESTKQAIRDAAPKDAQGRFLEPPKFEKPIDGPFQYGHKYGREQRRLALEAQRRGFSQEQFNDWVNRNPDFFQIESEARNLSHQGEKPGIEFDKGDFDGT